MNPYIHLTAFLLIVLSSVDTFGASRLHLRQWENWKGPEPKPPFQAIWTGSDGSFHLVAGANRHFRSANGLTWELALAGQFVDSYSIPGLGIPESYPQGGLWFDYRAGDWFMSRDRVDWLEVPWSPQAFGGGIFASLQGNVISLDGDLDYMTFNQSTDGQDWSLSITDIPLTDPLSLIGWVNGQWVARSPAPIHLFTSSDGNHWTPLALPESLGVDPRIEYACAGEGALLLLIGTSAVSTVDLENWKIATIQLPAGVGMYPGNQLIRDGDSFRLISIHTYHTGNRTTRTDIAYFKTNDFEHFELDPDPIIYPQSAANGIAAIEITRQEDNTVLQVQSETAGTFQYTGPSLVSQAPISSASALGDTHFAATPKTIFVSHDQGTTWEPSLTGEGSYSVPIGYMPPGMIHRSYGFHALTVWKDSTWVISDPMVDYLTTDQLRQIGGLWKWDPYLRQWLRQRIMPAWESRQLFIANGKLCLAGERDGSLFIELTEDGNSWSSHLVPIDPTPTNYHFKYVHDRFWLMLQQPADVSESGKVENFLLYSGDLADWTVALHNEGSGNGFRDLAWAGGHYILSFGNTFTESWYASSYSINGLLVSPDGTNWVQTDFDDQSGLSGRFTQCPDGSVLDWQGFVSTNGERWSKIASFQPPVYGGIQAVGDGFIGFDNYFQFFQYYMGDIGTGAISHGSWYTSSIRYFEVGEPAAASGWFQLGSLGILYKPASSNPLGWFWSTDLGWIWITTLGGPELYVFRSDSGKWIVIDPDAGGWFADYATGSDATLPLHEGRDFSIPLEAGMPFVYLPPGSYLMGAQDGDELAHPDEYPRHWETIGDGFWFGSYEVTQAEFTSLMGYNPTQNDLLGPDKPVVNLTREEAMDFCATLTEQGHNAGWLPANYAVSLPSEAEWEYAVTRQVAGWSISPYTNKLKWQNLDLFANAAAFEASRETAEIFQSAHTLLPVGSFPPILEGGSLSVLSPNHYTIAYPIYDAMGNVWEWCRNDYTLYDPAGTYPQGAIDAAANGYLSARGGGWFSPDGELRTCNRTALPPGYSKEDIGFRVVIRPTDPSEEQAN